MKTPFEILGMLLDIVLSGLLCYMLYEHQQQRQYQEQQERQRVERAEPFPLYRGPLNQF